MANLRKRIEKSVDHSPIPGRCSIHRVPEMFHKMTEPSKYKPVFISIGPFHRNNQRFKATEDLKLLYAHRLLTRTAEKKEEVAATKTSRTINFDPRVKKQGWMTVLDECILLIEKMEPKIRECYSEFIDLNSEEFIHMMVIDGLFITEMLITYYSQKRTSDDTNLYRNFWLWAGIYSDLLLLENQLPFFVLQCLFDHTALPYELERVEGMSLERIVPHFLEYHLLMLPIAKNLRGTPLQPEQCKDAKHLLGLLFVLLQPSSDNDQHMVDINLPTSGKIQKFMKLGKVYQGASTDHVDRVIFQGIPSARQLKSAGVRFKKGSKMEHFKFSSDGTFEISSITIFDDTDMMLRNIIACEQLYNGRNNMSCYAALMDSLINSVEDVEILRKAGIITNGLGCDEDVCNMFNKLCTHVVVNCSIYCSITREVNNFYNQRWHIWKATLKRQYFRNPWAIISVFAAVLLILLTIISTVFGILQVVHHKE